MFNKTKNIDNNILKYNENIDKIIENRRELLTTNSIEILKKVKESFNDKINDFNNEERKLRIAVIGQVKAGKSSFLNTLLFDGKEVLPKAATPKTATLTKIKYSDKNSLEIEFYEKTEWNKLEMLSLQDNVSNEVKVAKEIIQMVKERNINPNDYIDKKDYKVEFESYDELLGKLNDYAGENGKLTPLVKSLIMNINNKEIQDIEIVDTPGMNDPIESRTDKTRQYIEYCDVVFFLSQASSFLDKTDMDLLLSQLPQKGVNKIVLVASKYDSALLDVIWDCDDMSESEIEVKTSLNKVAKSIIESNINELEKRNANDSLIEVIKGCLPPLFVSSMAHNMSKKEYDDFNDEETNIYEGLCEIDKLSKDELRNIGNFEKIKKVFNNIIEDKDIMLADKLKNFIPISVNQIIGEINNIKNQSEKRNDILQNDDMEEIKCQQNIVLSQKHSIMADIEYIFNNLVGKIDSARIEILKDIRNSIIEYSNINERTGTEIETKSQKVSTSKWFNPFTWGSYRIESYTYDKPYTYIDVSDAVENLRNYSNECINNIESRLNKLVDISSLKSKILKVVIENFNTASENFDPAYFKLIVEQNLNNLYIPEININIDNYIKSILSEFSGEIRDSSAKSNLKIKLSESISKVFKNIEISLNNNVSNYKSILIGIKEITTEKLINDITSELDKIMEDFKDKEKEVQKNNEIIKLMKENEVKFKELI